MSEPPPTTDTMRSPSLDLAEPSRNGQDVPDENSSDESMNADNDIEMDPAEDDIIEEDSRIYTPPPHIAARFYRPSQARRRDSAASSRRNSFSSAHSRCSSIQPSSHRGGEQSKHVAQHLRRASFLEDRRARLADRAAHAEKVRLRAAIVKASHRDTTLSEERALAAQQARERNLAEIVANCAEEVKKAKQVAEFMKEKREQEIVKMRQQIDERLAEAEKRREELRKQHSSKRSRGQSVVTKKTTDSPSQSPEPEKRSLTQDEAAAKIQGWWLGRLRNKTIQEFINLGLTVDGIRETRFDTVVELLAQERVLVVTARLLRLCGLQEGDAGSVGEMAGVRTFLSAYLILGHPNQVLSNKDYSGDEEVISLLASHRLPSTDLAHPQLQDLVGKARDVLISFETILSRLTAANRYTMPPALVNTLPESYATFYNAFIAWKSRDSDTLIEVMLMQFVELDAIYHTVKDTTDPAAASLYKNSIQDNQLMLIVRIKKLAGQERGKKMIFEAVAEARKARLVKKRTADTKPRVTDNAAGEASETAKELVSSESQTLTPPPTPASKDQARNAAPLQAGLGELIPDNRIVIHELAINKEFQLSAEEYSEEQAERCEPIYAQLRAVLAHQDSTRHIKIFVMIAGMIRGKLQRLVKAGNSMYNLIGEILDPEMAERQIALGNFSYEKFFAAMSSLLPKLCAPFRDEEVKELQETLADGDIIDRLEELNGFIDVMLGDYINYMLRIAAPQLIELAADYEAKRFAHEVESGQLGFAAAETAWRAARLKVMAELQKRDPEGINHPKSRLTANRIYAQLLVDQFTKMTPTPVEEVPEMLLLDHIRIKEVAVTIQKIITCGAVLLQGKNLLKRDVRSSWKTEAKRVMAVIESGRNMTTTVDGIMAALESGRSMPATTKTHLRSLVLKTLTASLEMSQDGKDPQEPVMRLLLTRLRGNILARLAAGSASEKVRATTMAGEKLASLGLSEFVEMVRGVSELLEKIGNVDRAAHGPWWDAVATKVEQEEMS